MSRWMIFGLIWELKNVLNLKSVTQFKKDIKKYRHNEDVLDAFEEVVNMLSRRKKLPEKYSDHLLVGDYKGMREFHIQPDALLIYWVNKETKTFVFRKNRVPC